jgi:hypothetical protein
VNELEKKLKKINPEDEQLIAQAMGMKLDGMENDEDQKLLLRFQKLKQPIPNGPVPNTGAPTTEAELNERLYKLSDGKRYVGKTDYSSMMREERLTEEEQIEKILQQTIESNELDMLTPDHLKQKFRDDDDDEDQPKPKKKSSKKKQETKQKKKKKKKSYNSSSSSDDSDSDSGSSSGDVDPSDFQDKPGDDEFKRRQNAALRKMAQDEKEKKARMKQLFLKGQLK